MSDQPTKLTFQAILFVLTDMELWETFTSCITRQIDIRAAIQANKAFDNGAPPHLRLEVFNAMLADVDQELVQRTVRTMTQRTVINQDAEEPEDLINTGMAWHLAVAAGFMGTRASTDAAIYSGEVAGSFKSRGKYYVPRQNFEAWLRGEMDETAQPTWRGDDATE